MIEVAWLELRSNEVRSLSHVPLLGSAVEVDRGTSLHSKHRVIPEMMLVFQGKIRRINSLNNEYADFGSMERNEDVHSVLLFGIALLISKIT